VHAQWTESRQSMSRPVITTKHLLCTNHLSKLKRHIGGALPIDWTERGSLVRPNGLTSRPEKLIAKAQLFGRDCEFLPKWVDSESSPVRSASKDVRGKTEAGCHWKLTIPTVARWCYILIILSDTKHNRQECVFKRNPSRFPTRFRPAHECSHRHVYEHTRRPTPRLRMRQ